MRGHTGSTFTHTDLVSMYGLYPYVCPGRDVLKVPLSFNLHKCVCCGRQVEGQCSCVRVGGEGVKAVREVSPIPMEQVAGSKRFAAILFAAVRSKAQSTCWAGLGEGGSMGVARMHSFDTSST